MSSVAPMEVNYSDVLTAGWTCAVNNIKVTRSQQHLYNLDIKTCCTEIE